MVVDHGIYHVMTRGNNGQMTFHEPHDYQRYVQLLITYARQHHLHVHHFALMPNHVHLILRVEVAEELSKAMLGLNLTYALYHHRRYQSRGHLWQGRFKSFLIDRESYLLECGRYVELNPVRAGMVAEPATYPWSSYRFYAEGSDHSLLSPNPLYETFGRSRKERQAWYRQFVHDGIKDGQPQSLQEFEERFGVSLPKARMGRPRKKSETSPLLLCLVLLWCALGAEPVFAQSSNSSYALMQETVSSGGGMIGGGNPMQAQTALGLPAAGAASNGTYTLISGIAPAQELASPPVTLLVTVTGTIDDPAASVSVNGIAAINNAGTFSAQGVVLLLGPTTLTATATDSVGNSASRLITVYLDLPDAKKTPRFSIMARGTINDPASTVSVNGIQASIADAEFSVLVPLTSGLNTLAATASDPAGNSTTKSVRVFVPLPTRPPAKPTIGTVGDPLPEVTTVSSITIGGTKTAGTSIWINGVQVVGLSDATTWSTAITLLEGDNVLRIIAKDVTGVASAETVVTIIVDNEPPVVTFQPPAKTNLSPALLGGTVDDSRTTVSINGIAAQRDGLNFQASVPLTLGVNVLHIVAVSPRSLRTEFDRTITRGSVPALQSLQPADRSKLYISAAVAIQMTAMDPNNDPMEYRVLLDSQPLTAWSPASTQSLTPSAAQAGPRKLQAEVRDAYGGSQTMEIDVLILRQPVLPP